MRLRLLTLVFVFAPIAATADTNEEMSELSRLLGAENTAGFEKALHAIPFNFPRDHGPHPEFRNEWWYVTGNLDGPDGRRFGYELTIFRFALSPTTLKSASRWRSRQVYIAHFALTDAENQRFYTAQRFSRGAAGLAGAESPPFRVWIDNWQIAADDADPDLWRLQASGDDFSVDLSLRRSKPITLNGIDGLSQKSSEPGNASFYYSITRLDTDGQIQISDRRFGVSGLSWLDREWSSSALGRDQTGWDWFALQLDDGSDLMFYNLRTTAGKQDVHSAGTWVDKDGSSRPISRDQVSIDITNYWNSPAGGTYPAGWRLTVPSKDLTLSISPIMADQELFTTVRYWEGAVDVTGTRDGQRISGRGYVELTGYAEADD